MPCGKGRSAAGPASLTNESLFQRKIKPEALKKKNQEIIFPRVTYSNDSALVGRTASN
jgi:hypothetical protein